MVTKKKLIEAGVHIGHRRSRRNPKMSRYILGEKAGIHIINLDSTIECAEAAAVKIKRVIDSGGKILMVGTKRQAKVPTREFSDEIGAFSLTSKWKGGMLTNFKTIRKSFSKMEKIAKIGDDAQLSKRERLAIQRKCDKFEENIGSLIGMKKLPDLLVVIDSGHEGLAVAEAKKLGIPVIAVVDTDSDPENVDYPIPANGNSEQSIRAVFSYMIKSLRGSNSPSVSEAIS